ncbi:MAG: hypothetical protein HY072_02590 [Deltaproteobacteria bacterium]|nr:hypothetical protein [Deltaproteobacteria bacterium]
MALAIDAAVKGNFKSLVSTLDNSLRDTVDKNELAQKFKSLEPPGPNVSLSISAHSLTSQKIDNITTENTYEVQVTRAFHPLATLKSICKTITRIQRVHTFCFIHEIKFEPTDPNENKLPPNGIYNNPEGSPLLPLIQATQSTLDIEIYTMSDSSLREALRDALKRNVRIRVVKEPSHFADPCDLFAQPVSPAVPAVVSEHCLDLRKLVSEIQASPQGAFVPYALCKPGDKFCFQHGKIVISDNKVVMISTGNFDASNLCDTKDNPSKCNRDFSYITDEKEIVSTLEAIFESDLKSIPYDLSALLTAHNNQKLTVSPLSLTPLVDFIKSAQESIQIENQYLKDPTINQALIDMAGKKVKVSVTVSSPCSIQRPTKAEKQAFSEIYTKFDAAGIQSQIFNVSQLINDNPGYMHAKVIIIDGKRAWMGSVNGSTTSLMHNREFGIFFEDHENVIKLQNVMQQDFADPRGETWQDAIECTKDIPSQPIPSRSDTRGG